MEELIITRVGLSAQEHADIMNLLSATETKDTWIRKAVQDRLSTIPEPRIISYQERKSRQPVTGIIFSLLDKNNGVVTLEEIRKHIKAKGSISGTIANMVKRGEIKKVSEGKWVRTNKTVKEVPVKRSEASQKKQILDLIESTDRIVTFKEIYKLDITKNSVSRMLSELVAEGKIKRINRGKYQRA